jgi:hypothetical protein
LDKILNKTEDFIPKLQKEPFSETIFSSHTHQGVNFTNVLSTAFTQADPESVKRY